MAGGKLARVRALGGDEAALLESYRSLSAESRREALGAAEAMLERRRPRRAG